MPKKNVQPTNNKLITTFFKSAVHELQRVKRACSTVLEIIKEKDEEIEKYSKEISKTKPKESPNESPNSESTLNEMLVTNIDDPYAEFAGIFNDNQLKALRAIENAVSKDSTFILAILRFLYEDELDKLSNLSLKGKTKNKLPDEKLNIIKQMFDIRLRIALNTENTADIKDRSSRLNKLLTAAIRNAAISNQKNNANQANK